MYCIRYFNKIEKDRYIVAWEVSHHCIEDFPIAIIVYVKKR